MILSRSSVDVGPTMIFFFANVIVVAVEECSDVLGLNRRLDSLETELSLTRARGDGFFRFGLAIAALLVRSLTLLANDSGRTSTMLLLLLAKE